MAKSRSVVVICTGPAGSGKTYRRCARYMADEFLPQEEGRHISNFPINVDEMVDFVHRRSKIDKEVLRGRIEVIPEAVIEMWRDGESGPWSYFKKHDLTDCHIAIDEIHNFCGATTSAETKKKWQKWLGEIRHRGATVELLSQHRAKVARELHHEAGKELKLMNGENRRDPFFRVEMGDWYELKASLTRHYKSCVWETEYLETNGKMHAGESKRYLLEKEYFDLYDSYSTPIQGGKKASKSKKEYEKRSRIGLFFWFFAKNFNRFLWRVALVFFVIWLATGGGQYLFLKLIDSTQLIARQNGVGNDSDDKESEVAPINIREVPGGDPAQKAKPAGSVADQIVDPFSAREIKMQKLILISILGLKESKRREDITKKKLLDLRKQVESTFAVAMIGDDSVTFRNGYTYLIGEKIDYGPYKNRSVKRIDWKRRVVWLDDGHSLRMPLPGLQQPEQRGEAGSGLAGLVQKIPGVNNNQK